MKKKILACLLAALAVGSFTGCGCGGDPEATGKDGDTYILTVLRARDSGMTDGDRDEAVKKAIEDKFYEDTNIKISLNVQMYTNEAITDIVDVNFNNKRKNIDAICHYLSEDAGSAITKYAKDATATIDLDPVLEEYGSHILENINKNDVGHLADRAGYFNYEGDYYRTALTSYAKEGGYGIIMRKDLMRAVQAKTGLDPDDYDINSDTYKSMTVSEFERVMKAIKEDQNNDVTIPVNGKPWDLGRVVATAYGVDTQSTYGLDASGKLVPAQFTPNWDKYVDLMYRWARDGIWENESNNTTDDQRLTNLIAGKSAAYLAYPTAEQLINVSKRFYAANTGTEELMVIAPFATEDADGNAVIENGEQVVNGNQKSARAFYGLIVPYRSANYEILVQYIDWMYSSKENYELCQYGVKGVDWVEGDPFVYNGNTYETWAYPDDKVDEYLTEPPYTGKYVLLPNINVSNRICSHYNTVEKKWYTSLYFDFPKFSTTEVEGIWIPEASREYSAQATEIDGDYVDDIRSYAWVGRKNGSKTPTELLKDYVAEKKNSCSSYLNYLNNEYVKAKNYFNSKYAD